MSDSLRQHLLTLLDGKGAHLTFSEAVKDFPAELRGTKPPGAPHTAWQLLEHLRFTQHDLLEFSRNPDYHEPKWPDSYWPSTETLPEPAAWDRTIAAFESDLSAIKALVSDPARDLFAPYPKGFGKPLLRNVLILADHNSYHLGQLVFLHKQLEAPPRR